MEYFQNFNYHTHTYRCGHAGMYKTEEYVLTARDAGLKALGISDHCPVPALEFQDIKLRMHLKDAEEYISEINGLKEKYKDIEILSGFECEYDNMKAFFLSELRDKVDYLVLGQHFISDVKREGNSDYPTVYAHEVCAAMESGLFDMVAHPDIFMNYSDTFTHIEDQTKFMENARIASQMICEKAKELNIPLEINLHGTLENKGYPNKLFWEICEKVGTPVIYGVDAHDPKEFLSMRENMDKSEEKIGYANLNVLEYYNPVDFRNSNQVLQNKLRDTIKSAYTYEAMLANKTITNILNGLPEDLDKETLEYRINELLESEKRKLENSYAIKSRESTDESAFIARDNRLSYEEKLFYTSRIRAGLINLSETLRLRLSFINSLAEYVQKAIKAGAYSKAEIANIVMRQAEVNSTGDIESKIQQLEILNDFYKQKLEEGGAQKAGKLVKSNPLFGKLESDASPFLWSSDGFTNVMAVSMIIMFILGIGVGVAMMLLGM